ncbi:MAG: SDR family oxidoreductase [Gammaproteobacteria bacterium]|nr:SDR family oxidoreductase [Gammaproteobacteria bacterium]MCW8923317.1 SDR family oxidoreductase [Gammaproteobacteria bacterium]
MKILITGASRGIGFEMVRYGMDQGWDVLACCRHPQQAEKLLSMAQLSNGRVSVHLADMSELATLQALAYELRHEAIDMLINNAGVYGSDKNSFGQVDANDWVETLKVNTIAPLKMSELFIEQLSMGGKKIIACLSSKMGSMDDNTSGGSYIYRSSKAALNAVVKSMSHDLADRGIKCVALHPGWVKTDMGGPNAEISTWESVGQMFATLLNLKAEDSGRFIDIDGSDIPW